MKLRKLTKMQGTNDGTRSLFESVMMPEVIVALRDWRRSSSAGVLIGPVASSFYCKPWFTQEIDFLFLEEADIPETVRGFTRTSPDRYQHDRTHVEANLSTPSWIGVPVEVAEQVVIDAVVSDDIRVASASGLVALKLFAPPSARTEAEIFALLKTGCVDLSEWRLPPEIVTASEVMVEMAASDPD
jgi:hypothetical protein